MSLVEICNSKYNHSKIETFGKKYFAFENKILCEECIKSYIEEVSHKITDIIYSFLNNIILNNSLVKSDIRKDDEFTINYILSFADYMEYLLPTKYSLNANLFYREYIEDDDIDDGIIKHNIGTVSISSINCPEKFPKFNASINILDVDSFEKTKDIIRNYIMSFIKISYEELSDERVKAIMTNHVSKVYSSSSSLCSASSKSCSTCNGSICGEHYIYNNSSYCLNCMYDLVVTAAINANITDMIGLSNDQQSTTTYAIVNTPEWKRNIISKYSIIMKNLGIDTNIQHILLTIN